MKKSLILIVTLFLLISCQAQEKMIYPKYGNIGDREIYNNVKYLSLKPEVKQAYKAIIGTWEEENDTNFRYIIRFYERDLDDRSYYRDHCNARNISHPDFQTDFDMMIGGTGYDNINNLNKIFFRIGPSNFTGGVNQVSVSGFLHVIDDNTLRMEIMGVQHPSADDEEITIRADYKIETAPAEILERVPAVLRQKTLTFKRQTTINSPKEFIRT
ncbi:hypothetical protein KDU71_14555 [Carboxylicivirga sediminis]|uniref:Lipoprotein n=1 Tax=Carboxylicivirga sediminis TaxID=2006564 RepID=A0A941F5K9_9BACT|nr:hypothetical protein [Carboxylicivirga sediminis]MBR8536792.1 hypothetical protein [Carboxylicivirga sediminis]